MKESLATKLYDLVHAERFIPFSILFAGGKLFEIKTREHIEGTREIRVILYAKEPSFRSSAFAVSHR